MKYQFETRKIKPKRPKAFVSRRDRKPLQRVNLICCCAGWGKTTYLYQLCEEAEKAYYLSPDAEDQERLPELLHYAVLGETDSAEEVSRSGRQMMEACLKVLSENHALLLIDQADVLTSSGAAVWMRMLTDGAQEGHFRLVMAGRRIPDFLLTDVMEGGVQLYGIEEMRLTREELRQLTRGFDSDAGDVYWNVLEKYSGGWAAAAAELLRTGEKDCEKALPRTYLAPYIETHVLEGLREDLREYLLRTAFLPAEDEAFAADVLEISEPLDRLWELIRRGIIPEGDAPVYPEAMRHFLSYLLPSDTKKRLTEAASDYYIRHQRFAEAIRLFEVSGNIQGAQRLLKLYGATLSANCELELIGYCGRIISAKGRVTEPEALGALAQYYYYTGEYDKMEQSYHLADSMFGKENPYSVYRRFYNGLLRFAARPEFYRGNVRSALAYLQEHHLPLPFLYEKEREVLRRITDAEPEHTDPVLTVRRFGTLRLTVGEQQKEIQCKTRRSAELIAYLMEHSGGAAGRDELLHAFWPEEMPANAAAMLHNMIYHLRRELSPYGLENVIGYQNKRYRLDSSMIRDADEQVVRICQAAEKGDLQQMSSLQSAAASYWGTYLGTIDIPWANEKREYYDRCYITVCEALAEQYRQAGQYGKELDFLKNAFRLEPYSEQIMHDLLYCFVALGQPEKAKQYYSVFSERLDAAFGTGPSKWLRNSFLSCFSVSGRTE